MKINLVGLGIAVFAFGGVILFSLLRAIIIAGGPDEGMAAFFSFWGFPNYGRRTVAYHQGRKNQTKPFLKLSYL